MLRHLRNFFCVYLQNTRFLFIKCPPHQNVITSSNLGTRHFNLFKMSSSPAHHDHANSKVVILYGSQTGNAEEMSKRIGYQAKSIGYNVLVEAMDDFNLPQLARERFVIFVCSTTGHGQEPENMKNLYNFMRRRDLPTDCLKQLRFAVFGLGDSSYQKFNWVSTILYKRLLNCGAKPILQLVRGDEKHELGCDGVIYPNLEILWSENNPPGKEELSRQQNGQDCKESSYEVFVDNNLAKPNLNSFPFKETYSKKYNIKKATCMLNKRLTHESHFQDTRHFSFKCSDHIDYEPGDVCAILPENSLENVQQFIELLNLNPEDKVCVRKRDANYMVNYLYDFVPNGLRVFDLVKYYLDIQSVPRRSFFEYFWQFSEDELERNKLKEFASTEGQGEMYDYCIQPKRSILEVMADFPNTIKNVTLSYVLDMIPPIKPRSFSIASSVKMHPNEIHLIVGVVNYQTRLRKTRLGLCSTYLSKLVPIGQSNNHVSHSTQSDINFFIKRTSFKLPSTPNTPIIMIGPGLGIAPFRSFVEELSILGKEENPSNRRILYFGCRYREKDFYFEDELKKYATDGLLKLETAFSRENEENTPKRVQDLIRADSSRIKSLILNEKAMVYVAGNSKLPEQLRILISQILGGGNLDETTLDNLVKELEMQNRIQYDCW